MAKKLSNKETQRRKLVGIELLALAFVAVVATAVSGKYFYKIIATKYSLYSEALKLKKIEISKQTYKCPAGLKTIIIEGGKVCRPDSVENSIYTKIFDTYPFYSGGREQIYSFVEDGDITSADQILNNQIAIERFEPYKLNGNITWEEDPYNDRYWRFNFYSLRFIRNLFFAYKQTNDPKYLKKADQITIDFIDNGFDKKHSWDDLHGSAFRTMMFIKLWWQLRENNLLTHEHSEKLLKAIERQADFLNDPNNYEKGHNHGLNEAAALYEVVANFKDLPSFETWKTTSINRIGEGLTSVVDPDGVLIENSPYYHFYTLDKYWQIYVYSNKFELPISQIFNERIKNMVKYATYILQPDKQVPLLGASLARKINFSGSFKDIGIRFPDFQYVLSSGMSGVPPKSRNAVFPDSGEVIMRSGWSKDKNYINDTQLVYDAGPYRTKHSDLNALSFSLFGSGLNLIPDAGLYQYEEDDLKHYFYGTSSHNTVLVDEKDQSQGTVYREQFVETLDYSTQTASHQLYKGVTHSRSISLLGKNYLLIVDRLTSNSNHNYKQIFHLFNGASIKQKGLDLQVYSGNKEVMNIYQLSTQNISFNSVIGQNNPPRGLCSREYGKTIPCYSIEYETNSNNAEYVTLVEIGPHNKSLSFSKNGSDVVINDGIKIYNINLVSNPRKSEAIDVNPINAKPVIISTISTDSSIWINDNKQASGKYWTSAGSLKISTQYSSHTQSISTPVNLNLNGEDLYLRLKVNGIKNASSLNLELSSGNWKNYASMSLKGPYREEYDGEWLNISLGKGYFRNGNGGWRIKGSDFNWGKIDGIRIRLATLPKTEMETEISKIALTKSSTEGSVMFVFDDGYESILPAVNYMNGYGYKGSVAVIADRVEANQRLYLSLKQLQYLKSLGWDLVNHTQHHLNALLMYYDTKKMDEYEQDVVNGAKFLIKNGLNTNPNWFIYPNGATNEAIKNVVKKYYSFARTTTNTPESYPFADQYGIKTISSGGSEASNEMKFISAEDIKKAIDDAKNYHLPLFITFHRIKTTASDRPGYPLEDFKKIVDYTNKVGIKVNSLTDFDHMNNVNPGNMVVSDGHPESMSSNIKVTKVSFIDRYKQDIMKMINNLKKTLPN